MIYLSSIKTELAINFLKKLLFLAENRAGAERVNGPSAGPLALITYSIPFHSGEHGCCGDPCRYLKEQVQAEVLSWDLYHCIHAHVSVPLLLFECLEGDRNMELDLFTFSMAIMKESEKSKI